MRKPKTPEVEVFDTETAAFYARLFLQNHPEVRQSSLDKLDSDQKFYASKPEIIHRPLEPADGIRFGVCEFVGTTVTFIGAAGGINEFIIGGGMIGAAGIVAFMSRATQRIRTIESMRAGALSRLVTDKKLAMGIE
jgi:hypothetical protein